MTEKTEDKVETLPDLDDLLQCPVCYEIPSGQIFQCNEGHHVCGRCKMRLDVCPVCRAFFFGTRNYAMEELIANVRKLRAFKLGGKVTTGSPPAEVTPEVRESSSEENESSNENVNEDDNSSRTSMIHFTACRGLFRCLCCKNNPERLPLARLLNHLRYYHSPDLIEGRSENGGYLQAWQFPTVPGRMVTAVRVHDMGIFFLVIEVTHESVHAWMSMAASPWVSNQFSYSFTLSGNDREAIFSDCVWSVRLCEGSLKRRNRCLSVTGGDARALLAPAAMSGKLSVRRTPLELQTIDTQPRAVLRVANRSRADAHAAHADAAHDLEPFLQDLQNDVARLSRAFATLGREANALVRSEAEMRARLAHDPPLLPPAPAPAPAPAPVPVPALAPARDRSDNSEPQLSRSARRRMRQRLRDAFRSSQAAPPAAAAAAPAPRPQARRPPGGAAIHDDSVAAAVAAVARSAPNRNAGAAVVDPGLNRNIVSRPQSAQVVGGTARVSNASQTPADAVRSNGSLNSSVPVRPSGGQNSGNTVRAASGQPPTNTGRFNLHGVSSAVICELASRGLNLTSGPPVPPPPAPAPVPPPAFGGPSQDRSANGNTRNKKRRQRR